MTHLFHHTDNLVRHDAPYDKPGTYIGTILYLFYVVAHLPLNRGYRRATSHLCADFFLHDLWGSVIIFIYRNLYRSGC